ncbi:thiol-disulfide oxidoreductase DCC family protein [Psychrobacter okhotskensis]|uniref:thiol-disulfide oxidoreductase DCC family protein n=1 Tax=Psychrobacter okhotskensis TaxID=212403 RepID=UPI003D073DA6
MIIQNHINSYREQAHLSITMYYDDACVICSTEAHNMQVRQPEKIRLVPVKEGLDNLAAAGFSREDAMTYMCVQDSYDNWYTHMDAVRLLYRTGGVKWSPLLFLPVVKQLGDLAYPYVARNRYRIPNWVTKLVYGKAVMQACDNGVCKIAPDKR